MTNPLEHGFKGQAGEKEDEEERQK